MFKKSWLSYFFTFLFVQILCAQKSENIIEDKLQLADSIFFHHTEYSKKETLKKSISIYKKYLKANKDTSSLKNKKILAKKYAVKALLEVAEIRVDSAYPYLKKSLLLQQKFTKKDSYLKGHVYRQVYLYWGLKGKQDSVIYYTKKAEESFKDTLGLYHKYISEAMYERASAIGRKGNRREEVALSKRAIANNIAYQGEFSSDVAVQEHILATVYDNLGYYQKELESYKKVIKIWEVKPNHKDMSYLNIAYNSVCMWYLQHGDLKKAEQYLLKSESLVRNKKQDISNWFNETFKGRTQLSSWYYRGKLLAYKKDTVGALKYVNKILFFVNNFDKNKRENNPHNLSYFYEFVKNYQMAALRFKASLLRENYPHKSKKISNQILNISDVKKVSRFTLKDRLHIIDYYIKYDSISKLNLFLETNIKGAKVNNDEYSLLHFYAKKAGLLLKQKKYKELKNVYKKLFKKTQRDTTKIIDIEKLNYDEINAYGSQSILDILINASVNYKMLYLETNDKLAIKNAYSIIKLASEIFSKNFNHLRYNEQKYIITTKIHEQLLSIALLDESISKDEIIEIIEENGSKSIWNKFLNSQQRKFLNIPDSILQKENELLSELYYYKKQLYLNKENNVDKENLYKKNLLTVSNEIEEVEKWYQENYPIYYNQKVKLFKLKELKQKIKSNQKVIKYIFSEENLYAFIITKNNTKLIKVGHNIKINKAVKPLIKLLKTPNKKGYNTYAEKVYQLLLLQVNLLEDKKEELIFIQDDVLNYIPMETLIDVHGKFLIENKKVSYAPSLLLLNGQINAKKSKKNKLGIYAPIYQKYDNKNPKRSDNTALLGASKEATKIANIFAAELFTGAQANKDKFFKNASNYSMLHLAMHSSFNNVHPEFSSLNFSSKEKDNQLFVSELYNLSLNADLAVLSACNTGSGKIKKGEGLVNVSRAFTYAGVPSLVVSLWGVPDKETSIIMIDFYNELKKGKSKNEALQIAKLNYLNNAEYKTLKHPFYWAGFIVSGDVSPINTSFNYWWIIFVLGGSLLIFYRKKLLKLFQ
ncbi:MAG: CHAT domain-containing tetratricopeptide repeat protein [Polaribacter sp.]|uniref:CHAT domain-containing protein n=1 Tax=Polaribacter sp. TaxID=1920175 RepID=UPI003267D0C3